MNSIFDLRDNHGDLGSSNSRFFLCEEDGTQFNLSLRNNRDEVVWHEVITLEAGYTNICVCNPFADGLYAEFSQKEANKYLIQIELVNNIIGWISCGQDMRNRILESDKTEEKTYINLLLSKGQIEDRLRQYVDGKGPRQLPGYYFYAQACQQYCKKWN